MRKIKYYNLFKGEVKVIWNYGTFKKMYKWRQNWLSHIMSLHRMYLHVDKQELV